MRTFIVLLLIFVAVYGGWILYDKGRSQNEKESIPLPQDKKSTLPTEQFIFKHLLAKNGTIRTDFQRNPNGKIALSESIGLWMEYLVEKNDNELFEQAFLTVKEHFLSRENLIMWEINDGKVAQTNALIDDIRIIEALFIMGEREDRQDYIQLATNISKAVAKYNRQGSAFVDFYDTNYGYANEEITLSYLIPAPFEFMEKYEVISNEEMKEVYTFVDKIPLNNGFYPETYNVVKDVFYEDEIINLIDQLYTAIHIERFGIETDDFYTWLKETFYKERHLFGRYERQSKKEAVDYEAASVYALAIIYSMERDDDSFAEDLYAQMVTMQTIGAESTYFGGYVSSDTTHSFDNLLSLIAERKLRNEQVIQ